MSANGGADLPDLSGMIGKIMENPAALSMLSSLLSGTGGAAAPPAADARAAKPEVPAESNAADRRKLLLALKPFLSPERRNAVDRILQASELVSLFHRPAPH